MADTPEAKACMQTWNNGGETHAMRCAMFWKFFGCDAARTNQVTTVSADGVSCPTSYVHGLRRSCGGHWVQ